MFVTLLLFYFLTTFCTLDEHIYPEVLLLQKPRPGDLSMSWSSLFGQERQLSETAASRGAA